MAKGIGMMISITDSIIKAKRRYDESTTVKSTVEKLVKVLDKARTNIKKIIEEGGGKIREQSRKVKAKAKESAGSIRDRYKAAKEAMSEKSKSFREQAKEDGIFATLRSKFKFGKKSSSTDPPEDEPVTLIERFRANYKEVTDNLNARTKALKEQVSLDGHPLGEFMGSKSKTSKDLDEDADGKPSERSYLESISEMLSGIKEKFQGEEDDGSVTLDDFDEDGNRKKKPSWWRRSKERKDQMEAERERIRGKDGKGKKKKKGLFGMLFGLGMFLTKGVFKAGLGLTMFGLKKILPGVIRQGVKISAKLFWMGIKAFGKGLGKSLASLGKFLTPKPLRDAISKYGKMGIDRIKDLKIVLGDKITQLGGVLSEKIGTLGKVLGNTRVGKFAKKVFGKGTRFARAMTLVGKGVSIAARAFVATGPVGWAIAAGLAAWGAYKIYRYFKDGKGKFPNTLAGDVSYLRMHAYGLSEKDNSYYTKIFELEEIVGRFTRRDSNTGDVIVTEADDQGRVDIKNLFGFKDQSGIYEEGVRVWLSERFVPAYREFLRVLWNIDVTKKAGDIEDLTEEQLAELIYNYNVPGNVWNITHLPFKDKLESTISREWYDEYLSGLKAKTSDLWEARQKDQTHRRAANRAAGNVLGGKDVSEMVVGGKASKDLDRRIKALNRGGFSLGSFDIGDSPTGSGNYSMNSVTGRLMVDGDYVEKSEQEMLTGTSPIDKAIREASEATGVPVEVLLTLAKLESSLDPTSSNPNSSAVGLFQFTGPTWKDMIERFGKKYGLTLENANRKDPLHSALLAAEYIKQNSHAIRHHESAGLSEGLAYYLAHFLGPGGVEKLIQIATIAPNTLMEHTVGEDQYKANSIMHGKTVKQFIDIYRARYEEARDSPVESFSGYRKHKAVNTKAYEDTEGPSELSKLRKVLDKNILFKNDKGKRIGSSGSSTSYGNVSITNMGDMTAGPGIVGGGFGGAIGNGVNQTDDINYLKDYLKSNPGLSGSDDTGGAFAKPEEVIGTKIGRGDSTSVHVHPIREGQQFYFTSLFGHRNTGIENASTNHGGVDIGTPARKAGAHIVATGAGRVARAEYSSTYGYVVYLHHPDGYQTRYAHLHKLMVKRGEEVDAGQIVGLMGNTGTGDGGVHLHFEVIKGHKEKSPKVDPFEFRIMKDSFLGHRVATIMDGMGNFKRADGKPSNKSTGASESMEIPLPELNTRDVREERVDPVTGLSYGTVSNGSDKRNQSLDSISPYNDDAGYSDSYSDGGGAEEQINLDVKVDTKTLEERIVESNDKLGQMVGLLTRLVGGEGAVAASESTLPANATQEKGDFFKKLGSYGNKAANAQDKSSQSINFVRGSYS